MLKTTRYAAITPYMVFSVVVYLQGAILFGIDTGSFGSLQALPSFLNTFGSINPKTGKRYLPSSTKAAMNSIPFAGQAVGALFSEAVADYLGYKMGLIVVAVIQLIAIVISLTSNLNGSWGQFTAGRFIAYISTGIAEMIVTNYLAEISPASTRGLVAGSMVLFNALGNFWGTGMSRAFSTETAPRGWIIPQAVQMIPAVIALALVWFTPESPRWLILKNQREKAIRNLKRLRSRDDHDNIEKQTEAIEASIMEAGGHERVPWSNLFKGNMLRRTWIACSLFVCMQFSGVQFVNSYGATFYVQYGLGANSFTYITIGNSLQVVTCLFCIIMFDFWGRRLFAIACGFFGFIFLTVIASVGSQASRSSASVNSIIASIILLQVFSRWAVSIAFVVSSEIGGPKMRKKLMAVCGVVNMMAAILLTSVLPYLMDSVPGSAGLGAKVGWFFAASNVILMLFGIFLIPELQGRSLEETEELFDAGLIWGWQFAKYKTTGIGAQIAALERIPTAAGTEISSAEYGEDIEKKSHE